MSTKGFCESCKQYQWLESVDPSICEDCFELSEKLAAARRQGALEFADRLVEKMRKEGKHFICQEGQSKEDFEAGLKPREWASYKYEEYTLLLIAQLRAEIERGESEIN